MRFVTFRSELGARPGVVIGDQVVDLSGAGYADLPAVIAGGESAVAKAKAWLAAAPESAVRSLSAVALLAPLQRPPKLICVGLNYRDHALETNMKIPDVPTIFAKFQTAIIGPGENIVLPRSSTKPDYEAEFAFVIGKGGRHIAAENWREHVFGYTALNDVSARDYQMATTQWTVGKSFDTFAPMGPWIVTADEIAEPHDLDISLTIGGEVLQSSNTSNLIFRIPGLVGFLSSVFTLEPGDVVSTGTPAGVGFARKPPRYLRPGDEVVVSIEGIGELRNPVVAEGS
jgi:2-keto-4-pentenoate hydratase/2-oxohepta-3-ene-1,7-dioic acid hydratase in catechol pathway